jgi:hypothetical protein
VAIANVAKMDIQTSSAVASSFDQIYCLSLQIKPSGAAALRLEPLGAPQLGHVG